MMKWWAQKCLSMLDWKHKLPWELTYSPDMFEDDFPFPKVGYVSFLGGYANENPGPLKI